jgi:hypothetical protein
MDDDNRALIPRMLANSCYAVAQFLSFVKEPPPAPLIEPYRERIRKLLAAKQDSDKP